MTDKEAQKNNFIQATGKRKTAIAQVKLVAGGKGNVVINNKKLEDYFPVKILQDTILKPLRTVSQDGKFDVIAKVIGGGKLGQAQGVSLGIARALIKLNDEEFRPLLRAEGLLTRDSRIKERKKPGLRGARRAPQWAKR